MSENQTGASEIRKVAILCANNVQVDSRVRKIGRSALELGFDPLVIGISRSKSFEETKFDGVRTILVDNSEQRFRHYSASHLNAFPWGLIAYRSKDQVEFKNLYLMAEYRAISATIALGMPNLRRVFIFKVASLVHKIRRMATSKEYLTYVQPNKVRFALRRLRLKLSSGSRWAYYEPTLLDFSALMIPELEKFRPNVIHANDTATMVAALVYKRRFTNTKIIYDMHEWVHGLPGLDSLKADAYIAAQDRYIHGFDDVLTVSSKIADLIRDRYKIEATILENLPWHDSSVNVVSIRNRIGLPKDAPLIVYSGWIAPERGLDTVLLGLKTLDSVHLAIVSNQDLAADKLVQSAAEIGVANRVHVVPYVNPSEIVSYLQSCTAGLIPLEHAPNHEISRITKFFEYANARIPIVCSDVKTMSDSITELGIGEVFTAKDVDSFVHAVNRVLQDPDRYTSRYTEEMLCEMNWQSKHETLSTLYFGR